MSSPFSKLDKAYIYMGHYSAFRGVRGHKQKRWKNSIKLIGIKCHIWTEIKRKSFTYDSTKLFKKKEEIR